MTKKSKKKSNELERNRKYLTKQGKKPQEITYGMLCDGFRSLSGIPDDFCSAEDPADRARLYNDYQSEQSRGYFDRGYED